MWVRDHTYEFAGNSVDVHEDWWMHRVQHFDPAPADLSDFEKRSIAGFCWWRAEDLRQTSDSVFPPNLGEFLASLLREGPPLEPIDISDLQAR